MRRAWCQIQSWNVEAGRGRWDKGGIDSGAPTAGRGRWQRASWLWQKGESEMWNNGKRGNTEREEGSKSRDSIMQTTDSSLLHHHFPAFDVSLHSCSGDEQERGGSGREKAMKRRRKSRQRYEKHQTQKPAGEPLWWHHCLLDMEAAGGVVGMERRAGRDGGGCGRDT